MRLEARRSVSVKCIWEIPDIGNLSLELVNYAVAIICYISYGDTKRCLIDN